MPREHDRGFVSALRWAFFGSSVGAAWGYLQAPTEGAALDAFSLALAHMVLWSLLGAMTTTAPLAAFTTLRGLARMFPVSKLASLVGLSTLALGVYIVGQIGIVLWEHDITVLLAACAGAATIVSFASIASSTVVWFLFDREGEG